MTNKDAILANVTEHQAMAKRGLDDIESGNPTRLRPGIMNLAVFGRSTTNVLQNLRSVDPDFDVWYAPKVAEMKASSVMRYFYEMRTKILKEGPVEVSNITSGTFRNGDMAEVRANAPPNTESFFFGDYLGGDGYFVRMPDGTVATVYHSFKVGSLKTVMEFRDAPTEHDGTPIEDSSVAGLSRLYYDALSRIVDDALDHFGGS